MFAAISIVGNLAAQRVVLGAIPGTIGYVAAVLIGTLAGLVIKFVLDRRWIFAETPAGIDKTGRQFLLYSLMGIATTAIFWGSETLFWLTFRTDLMRESGAILGLVVGYVVKYQLDKRFVFRGGAVVEAGA